MIAAGVMLAGIGTAAIAAARHESGWVLVVGVCVGVIALAIGAGLIQLGMDG